MTSTLLFQGVGSSPVRNRLAVVRLRVRLRCEWARGKYLAARVRELGSSGGRIIQGNLLSRFAGGICLHNPSGKCGIICCPATDSAVRIIQVGPSTVTEWTAATCTCLTEAPSFQPRVRPGYGGLQLDLYEMESAVTYRYLQPSRPATCCATILPKTTPWPIVAPAPG